MKTEDVGQTFRHDPRRTYVPEDVDALLHGRFVDPDDFRVAARLALEVKEFRAELEHLTVPDPVTAADAYKLLACEVLQALEALPDDGARARFLWLTIKDLRVALFKLLEEE